MSDFSKPVLAVDSALAGCIAAVLDPVSGTCVTRVLKTDRDQAARLVPMVQDLMAEASVSFAQLGLIVTTTGPGSFTGLRIGMSTARAWGMALNIPVQGVTTFEAMEKSCRRDDDVHPLAVILETKRGDFYFRGKGAEPFCGNAAAVRATMGAQEIILCGDAVERFVAESGKEGIADTRVHELLDPAALAKAGLELFVHNGSTAQKPEPYYMRGADVSMSNKTQRQIQDLPV